MSVKKFCGLIVLCGLLTILCGPLPLHAGLTAFAGEAADGQAAAASEGPAAVMGTGAGWKHDANGYWYENADGSYLKQTMTEIDGNVYLFNADGYMLTGWQTYQGGSYYFFPEGYNYPEGSMAKNMTIQGRKLMEDGHEEGTTAAQLQPMGTAQAQAVLDQVGWDLRAAFNWSASLPYYRFTADPAWGTRWFADYGFTKHTGNCYVMAATFCEMAQLLGYEARQMAGLVPSRTRGLTPHSWCEVNVGGTVYVFDPNFTNETGKNGYQIHYGQSGTWRYQSYSAMS